MPKRRSSQTRTDRSPKRTYRRIAHETVERENDVLEIVIPDPEYSGDSDNADEIPSDIDDVDEVGEYSDDEAASSRARSPGPSPPLPTPLPTMSYCKRRESYPLDQMKLEPDHGYEWVSGETVSHTQCENECFLDEAQKNDIIHMSHVQLFELSLTGNEGVNSHSY